MAHENIITGIDIGSHAIKVAVGQIAKDNSNRLHVVGVAQIPSAGVQQGSITSIDDAVKQLSQALELVEKFTGMPMQYAWVGIAGTKILSQVTKGVVAVSKTDGEISPDDVERAINNAKTVTCPPNYELLHIIPRSYTVDGQEGIKDPIGMHGIRLEVDAFVILGLSSHIKNITKTVYQTGLDIHDLVFSILGTASAVLTAKQKEIGVAVVNIGSSTTSIAVYEEGTILHTAVIPIGSDHITRDIAIGLRTSIEVADEIKVKFGCALQEYAKNDVDIRLQDFSEQEEGDVQADYVSEIIEARIEEIFERVDQELDKIDRSGMLPAGAVLTGGGAKLPKMVEAAKKYLRLPASLGYPVEVSSVVDTVNDMTYTTAIGIMIWSVEVQRTAAGPSRFKSVDMVSGKVRKWLQSLMP